MLSFNGIFDWSGWDQFSDDSKIFYDCTLLVDVGEYDAHHKFDEIYFIDDGHLRLEFYEGEKLVMTKKLGIID